MSANQTRGQEALARVQELATKLARTYSVRDERREFPYEEMARLKQSGLLAMPVPHAQGGMGLPFADMIDCLMTLTAGNPSVAQMFFVHCAIVWSMEQLATPTQLAWMCNAIVRDQAFFGNAASEKQSKHVMAFETAFTPTPKNDGVLIRGKKFFTTGSLASDYLLVFGVLGKGLGGAIVPKDAPGMSMRNDWNAMGQRGTASGTIDFEDVFVKWDMVLPQLDDTQQPDPGSFLGLFYQTGFSAIHAGIARGALTYATTYVKTKARPWSDSGVTTAQEDPYILQEVGKMRAYLSGAEALVRRAAKLVEIGLAARGTAGREEMTILRGEAGVAVAEAKLVSTEVALRVCQDIFQVCGARSAMGEENLDRFWRDARTLTLHDPKEYKAKLIGEYVLQGKYPPAGLYT